MRHLVAVTVGLLSIPALILAQTSPLIGTWKMDATKSTYSPGPGPKSQTIKWERVQGGYRFFEDIVRANGQATHQVTVLKDDGSDTEVQGAATPTMRHLRRIDDWHFEDGDKVNGTPTVTRNVAISSDGRTMTVTMTGNNAQGQPVKNVAVFERQ